MGRAPGVSQGCSGVFTSEPCLKQLHPSCLWTLWDAFQPFFLAGKWPLKSSGLGSHLLVVIRSSAVQPWQREGSLQLSQLGLGWDGLGSISTRQKKSQIIKTTQPLMIFLMQPGFYSNKTQAEPSFQEFLENRQTQTPDSSELSSPSVRRHHIYLCLHHLLFPAPAESWSRTWMEFFASLVIFASSAVVSQSSGSVPRVIFSRKRFLI